MAKTIFPAGMLDDIQFVIIFTRYKDKWVYCWHKYRKSFEHPGGHVDEGETVSQAAFRELYEETGIKDCSMYALWDYEYIWEDGSGKNNGRVFLAMANDLGEMPDEEMERIELFDDVPENYTYDREEERRDMELVIKLSKAHFM